MTETRNQATHSIPDGEQGGEEEVSIRRVAQESLHGAVCTSQGWKRSNKKNDSQKRTLRLIHFVMIRVPLTRFGRGFPTMKGQRGRKGGNPIKTTQGDGGL